MSMMSDSNTLSKPVRTSPTPYKPSGLRQSPVPYSPNGLKIDSLNLNNSYHGNNSPSHHGNNSPSYHGNNSFNNSFDIPYRRDSYSDNSSYDHYLQTLRQNRQRNYESTTKRNSVDFNFSPDNGKCISQNVLNVSISKHSTVV